MRIVDCGEIATTGEIESLLEKDRLSINAEITTTYLEMTQIL
jgi:hypothetical protein